MQAHRCPRFCAPRSIYEKEGAATGVPMRLWTHAALPRLRGKCDGEGDKALSCPTYALPEAPIQKPERHLGTAHWA